MLRLALQRARGAGPSRPAAGGETSRARSRAACASGQPGCLARRSCSAPPSSPTEQVERIVELPLALVKVLDGWGPPFCSKVRAALAAECDRLSVKFSWPASRDVVVGTDCSGAEAPIWALRAMQVPHVHAFSCDSDAKARAFIEATCPPAGPLFHDMLTRDVTCIPPHSVYVCGFPCKAFSMLRRHSTKLLQEVSAKPFFAAVAVLRQCRPRVAVFENVLGIRAVLPKVLRKLRQVAGYYIFVVPIDSVDRGEPVCRPRIYLVLVRQDCTISDDMAALCAIVRAGYASACGKVRSHVCERMLPASSPEVRRLRRRKGARPSGTCADYLTTARQEKVWAKLRAKHSQGDLIADVSQSLSRSSPRAGGVCPTLTPRGIVMAQRAGRPVSPIEKLILHGFPVHHMKIPASIDDVALARLGGNTMHLKSVGLAVLLGVGLVDWSTSGGMSSRAALRPTPAARAPLLERPGLKKRRKC